MQILLLFFALSVSFLAADVVKIGANIPMSGEYAFIGEAYRDAMQLALKDYGPTKHEYKIIFEDNGFVSSKVAMAGKKLVEVDKVDIVTTMFGPPAFVMAPYTERSKVFHLAADWSLEWTEKYKYTANVSNPCDVYAELMLKMIQKWGTKRIAIIQQNSADWKFAEPYLLKAIKSDPSLSLVANEKYNSPVRDFRTLLIKIEEKKPDLIIVWTLLPESEIIMRQARQLQIKGRFTGYFEDFTELKLIEGQSFLQFTNTGEEFAKHYREKFNKEVPYGTAFGYDHMGTILRVYEQFDKKPDALTAVNAVSSLKPWQGCFGLLAPRGERLIQAPYKVKKVVDGKIIEDPDFAELNNERKQLGVESAPPSPLLTP